MRSDMSAAVKAGYLYFDSICRSNESWGRLDTILRRLRTWKDIYRYMRYRYLLSEYDDDLFKEYLYGGSALNGYPRSPAAIDFHLKEQANRILGGRDTRCNLVFSDLILHVRISEMHSDSDITASIPVSPLPLMCITAKVIDTIKGKHIRRFTPNDANVGSPGAITVSFVLSPYWEKEHSRGDVVSAGIDSLGIAHIPCNNCYGAEPVKVGHEYIVFLRNILLYYNGAVSYYDYWPMSFFSAEGGIFEIDSNSNVLIPSDYFGYGSTVPFKEFERKIREEIRKLTD